MLWEGWGEDVHISKMGDLSLEISLGIGFRDVENLRDGSRLARNHEELMENEIEREILTLNQIRWSRNNDNSDDNNHNNDKDVTAEDFRAGIDDHVNATNQACLLLPPTNFSLSRLLKLSYLLANWPA